MPPGRSGFNTIKTIEETLRSKAGKMGGTRKEIPARLERLEAMGIFKRELRQRGAVEVPTGELVLENPTVKRLTAGLSQPEAKVRTPRAPRAPRRAEPEEPVSALEDAATDELPAEVEPELVEPAEAAAAEVTAEADGADAGGEVVPFRWVSPPVEAEAAKPAAETKKPARRSPRKTTGSSTKTRTSRSKASADEAEDKEPTPA